MARYGVVVSNIGTPKSPKPKDVAKYLRQFLMDKYVIDIPWPSRFVLVNGIIAPFRSKRSGKAYQKIWTEGGSPLLTNTVEFAKGLEGELGDDYKVVVGMRYGEPSMAAAVASLKSCDSMTLFPQYPQYAESPSRTCSEAFFNEIKSQKFEGETKVIEPFFNDEDFVGCLAERVNDSAEGKAVMETYDHLLFSYHGLPERHLTKIDPVGSHCANYKTCCEEPGLALNTCYRAQAFATSRALAQTLNLQTSDYSVSFQSRLGRQVWIPPFTDHMLEKLAKSGVKRLGVICPSFVADCLETLEEIAMEGRKTFLDAGGEAFTYIPCPNAHPRWVRGAAQLIKEH